MSVVEAAAYIKKYINLNLSDAQPFAFVDVMLQKSTHPNRSTAAPFICQERPKAKEDSTKVSMCF